MSSEIVANTPTDLTEIDLVKVKEFIEDGKPGISRMDDATLYRMTDMYLSGSTYHQISIALSLPRILVLYASQQCSWYDLKNQYLLELDQNIKGRVATSNLISQEFLLLLIQVYQKQMTKKFQRYLATDDTSHTEDIDLKEVDKLLKTIEMLKEFNSEGKSSKGKTPAVGLNLGEGVTVERTGDNKVTITPKQRVVSDVLSKYAEKLRAEENSKKPDKKHDISENVTKTQE